MSEIRGPQLEVIDKHPTDIDHTSLDNGQLVLATVITDPSDRGVGELYELHLSQQRKEGLASNGALPTHYPLTLQNSQVEAFLPVLQGVKGATPIMQVTGRVLDFAVQKQTLDRDEDSGITNYAIADTAHMPAIVKLRQLVAEASDAEYVSQFKDLLNGNGDIFCIWEVGSMALKGVVSTTEVSPVDYCEVDAVPDVPAPHKELKRPERLTYQYSSTFTDLESYEDEALKLLIQPILNGLKHPNSRRNIAFLHHVTRSIFDKDYLDKKVPARYKNNVEAVLTRLNNANHQNNPVAPLASLAHSLVRARLMLEKIDKDQAIVKNGKLVRNSIPGEPTFEERREKVWFELAHCFGFEDRIHALHQDYVRMAKLADIQKVQVFSRLRVQFRAHDDLDAVIAKHAKDALASGGEDHQQAALLQSFIAIDFYGQRDNSLNLTIMGLAGTQLKGIRDVHLAAETQKKPTTMLAVSSDNSEFRVVTPPYYPSDVIHAFRSKTPSGDFVNTVPGVVAHFQMLLPEIEQQLDSMPPKLEEFPREYVVTSAKYQPWAVSEFILQSMFGTKGKYHELRQAIKDGAVSWQSIMEQKRIQSWTLLAEAPIQADNPQSLREVVAIGKPFYNGAAFLVSTYVAKQDKERGIEDGEKVVYFDRGTVRGQSPRTRKPGVIAKKGILVNDKKIARPQYTKPQSLRTNRHQLEVIFAANSVFAKDGASGSGDQVLVRVPKHWKRVVQKRRKGLVV